MERLKAKVKPLLTKVRVETREVHRVEPGVVVDVDGRQLAVPREQKLLKGHLPSVM